MDLQSADAFAPEELELSEVDKYVPGECCEVMWAVRRVSESVTKV